MDYEQKYNAALKIAEEVYHDHRNDNDRDWRDLLTELFPELKESEDEKIRKEIRSVIEQLDKDTTICGKKYDYSQWIAWLEKQGKQKTAVYAPKFRVGDIVKSKSRPTLDARKIISVDKNRGCYWCEDNMCFGFTWEDDYELVEHKPYGQRKECEDCQFNYVGECKGFCQMKRDEQKPADDVEPKFKVEEGKWYVCISQFCDCVEGRVYKATSDSRIMDDFGTECDMHSDAYKYFRLWTIHDAKDGDVLVVDDEYIVSFNDDNGNIGKGINLMITNFHYNFEDDFYACGTRLYYSTVCPATKEQRDLLFAKMKEAGYEWNAEKKELKKIEVVSKGSKDEQIRKAIKSGIKHLEIQLGYDAVDGVDILDIYSWLEKQDEQKPFNYEHVNIQQKDFAPVEPKFKVGDWISGYYTNYKVTAINSIGYVVEDTDGNKINILFENEKFHHLWTIQDAKDGDVLASKDGYDILIFRNLDSNENFSSYYNIMGRGELGWSNIRFIPATKEQRDLLFQKMKIVGYEWDSEKKELKKIESKKLDANKVIEWLKAKVYDDSAYGMSMIDQFKKDFGLWNDKMN